MSRNDVAIWTAFVWKLLKNEWNCCCLIVFHISQPTKWLITQTISHMIQILHLRYFYLWSNNLGMFFMPIISYGNRVIAKYGVFCLANMLFYYLTFLLTGVPNLWRKKNLKLFGGTPPLDPLIFQIFQIDLTWPHITQYFYCWIS